MVCGNMEVEAAPETFIDDLYDNKEDKVVLKLIACLTVTNFIHTTFFSFFNSFILKSCFMNIVRFGQQLPR